MTRKPLSLEALLLSTALSLLLLSGVSARRTRVGVADRSSSISSSSTSSSSLPPLAPRLVTSFHGQAPNGEIIPCAGRGTFSEFLNDLKRAADAKMVSKRPIEFLFDEASFVLDCRAGALWLEFGVYDGTTLRLAADWRAKHCGSSAPPVFGFDTFEGLPETWDQGAGGDSWEKGSFDLEGKLPPVPDNAKLVKGLFADTLPQFLAEARGLARHYPSPEEEEATKKLREEKKREAAARRRGGSGGSNGKENDDKSSTSSSSSSSSSSASDLEAHVNPSGVLAAGGGGAGGGLAYSSSLHVSYLHIDCDLYAGARDALSLLSPLIRPGTVLVFDDLVNYPAYRDHEVKALWEWVASTGLHLRVIGAKGPLPVEEEEAEKKEEGAERKEAAAGGAPENGGGGNGKGGPSGGKPPPPSSSRNPPPQPRAVDLDPKSAAPHHHQSVAFLVV